MELTVYSNYIYYHIDPVTKEVVYIGRGSGSRAWFTAKTLRSKQHLAWINNLLSLGYTPDEWVFIKNKKLSKQEAVILEETLIKEQKPKFNKFKNPDWQYPSFLDPLASFILGLREMGYSYTHIAFLCGAESAKSRENKKAMTFWRFINGRI